MAYFTKSVFRLLESATLDQDLELVCTPALELVICRDPSYIELIEINGKPSFLALAMLYQCANPLAIK